MHFQTERCLQCRNPRRPTDLQSKYAPILRPDGGISITSFWFCSDKCFDDAVNEYLDKEYIKPITVGEKFPPKLLAALRAAQNKIIDRVIKQHGEYYTVIGDSDYVPDYLREAGEEIRAVQGAIIQEWEVERVRAIGEAQRKMLERIHAEDDYLFDKQCADELKEIDEEERKFWEDDEREENRSRKASEELARRIEMMTPRPIPPEARFEHTHIIGSSGSGKSTLIIKQFGEDLTNAAIVVIDRKGTLVDRLSRLQYFFDQMVMPDNSVEVERNRLVLIDPTKCAPALNMFAPSKRKYQGTISEQMENNTISLFQYMFSSKDSPLTDKQLTCFSYCVKLLFTIPNATILTFFDLLKDPHISKTGGIRPDSPFRKYIDKLNPISRQFFYDYFYDLTEYGATKDQIATRIHGMLRYSTFQKMFLTTENKIDMFENLQSGKVVLVSSPQAILGKEGSRLLSRYFVALTLQAAFERITIPREEWKPAYLFIDEAQEVVDESKTQDLLQQAREFKLGVTLAHQQIKGQLTEAIFSTLSANTRIKYAATRSHADAVTMAKDMHCEPEFIMGQKRIGDLAHFACYCDGVTEHPFPLELDCKEINALPLINDTFFSLILCDEKRRYAATEKLEEATEPPRKEGSGGPPAPIEEKAQPTGKLIAPEKASKPVADPHTGEHTEPAAKWGA